MEGQASGRPLVSASTRAKYIRHLENHILPRWRDTLVHEFRAKPVLDWLQQEGQSWYMMADLRNLLSGIFTKAQEWELLPDSFANPMHRVRLPRKWEVRQKRILSHHAPGRQERIEPTGCERTVAVSVSSSSR